MDFSLKGKTCLVTGGSRGIGKAIALEMARSGADVAITYTRSGEAADEVRSEIEQMGRKAKAIQADAVDAGRAAEVVEEITSDWSQLDILVNNAGITKDTLVLRMDEEQWDSVIKTNLNSVFNYSKAVLRPMMRQRNGSIINIGSIIGITGNAGQTNYAASKAGIIGFSKSLAKEVGSRNIRVNVVAPGYIMTEMTENLPEKSLDAIKAAIPLNRPGETDDVAGVVVFLSSDAGAYLTGTVIQVDGGMAM